MVIDTWDGSEEPMLAYSLGVMRKGSSRCTEEFAEEFILKLNR
jgi:hypothetical protein